MNEIANFCDGDCNKKPIPKANGVDFDPNYPPYKVNNGGHHNAIFART
jgi:hypothetical protein